ncbi:MAG TPA: protein-tyrosine-phosphatase, partial [Ohtaekwangia sp.]|nr:protein-tyrosine-phosphatase [Ohtaekwangia sp.]
MSILNSDSKVKFYPSLEHTISFLTGQFDKIPEERRLILNELSALVQAKVMQEEKTEVVFICTHNSRRSHIAQLWAQAAAAYYEIANLISYSGGTEATSFNPRAVRAMNDIGFRVDKSTEGENPIYVVSFSEDVVPVFTFSKKYDAESNPKEGFIAVMTCEDADE